MIAVFSKGIIDPLTLSLLVFKILGFGDQACHLLCLMGEVEKAMVKVDRCLKVTEVIQENLEGENLKEGEQWPKTGELKFKKTVAKYRPGTQDVLRELDLTIKGGEKVGVVGRTGAGKSTLSMAMTRIIELTSGSIEIDSKDVSKMALPDLRSKITIIPQDPVLFKGTLRMNLDPAEEQKDEVIIDLLKRANLGKMIEEDKEGINMQISEGGSNLSSGQKQLICLCRAALKRNQIVILDEATSNIDVITEQHVQQLIHSEFKDCTMITIAHRLNTIMSSDKILVMDQGQVAEFDSPEVLKKNEKSEFRRLLKSIEKKEK